MIYLKKYNESFRAPSSFREEIQEFCENCLAYLIDEDFSIETNLYGLDPVSVSFVLIRRFSGEVQPFSWNDGRTTNPMNLNSNHLAGLCHYNYLINHQWHRLTSLNHQS